MIRFRCGQCQSKQHRARQKINVMVKYGLSYRRGKFAGLDPRCAKTFRRAAKILSDKFHLLSVGYVFSLSFFIFFIKKACQGVELVAIVTFLCCTALRVFPYLYRVRFPAKNVRPTKCLTAVKVLGYSSFPALLKRFSWAVCFNPFSVLGDAPGQDRIKTATQIIWLPIDLT